jgi:putative transcriptional regulator
MEFCFYFVLVNFSAVVNRPILPMPHPQHTSALERRAMESAAEERVVTSGKVDVPRRVDARAIRRKLGLSQDAFAARFGISVATLRDWEQRRRRPEGPGRVLLTIIEREPEAVARALSRR